MARVPITVMGYRCERCNHEWIPRDFNNEPAVCPKCKSPYWDRPRRMSSGEVPLAMPRKPPEAPDGETDL